MLLRQQAELDADCYSIDLERNDSAELTYAGSRDRMKI